MDIQEKPFRYKRRQIFAAEHIPVMASHHVLEGDHQLHDHDFMEVALIVGGSGLHYSMDEAQPIGEGDAFVCRPGTWHAYRSCSGLVVENCCFRPDLLQRELAWTREDPLLSYLFWHGPSSLDRRGLLAVRLAPSALAACRANLHTLERLAGADHVLTKADQLGHLLLFLTEIARALIPARCGPTVRRSAPHPAVIEGLRLLEDNSVHPWTLAELAGQLHLARSYLVRLWKAETGLSPMAYLLRRRLERAAVLLLRTDSAVGEIGHETGFSDPNYFARSFKLRFGVSPTDYRRALTGTGVSPKVASKSSKLPS